MNIVKSVMDATAQILQTRRLLGNSLENNQHDKAGLSGMV
jgi:hypothetical protein